MSCVGQSSRSGGVDCVDGGDGNPVNKNISLIKDFCQTHLMMMMIVVMMMMFMTILSMFKYTLAYDGCLV